MLAALVQRLRAPLPGQCEVCRRFASAALCEACLERHAAARPRCLRCALPLAHEQEACGECLREPPAFDRSLAVADYGFPWDALIAAFKFRQQVELAGALAPPMAARWLASREATTAAVVVPVPMSAEGLRRRGYNQAWELARRIAAPLGLVARADLLVRTTDVPQQVQLTRAQRLANLRAAFAPAPQAQAALAGRTVVLVDDVMTTGATAQQAALALRRGGASRVELLVFARTPSPGRVG